MKNKYLFAYLGGAEKTVQKTAFSPVLPEDAFSSLKNDVLRCHSCRLRAGATQVVFGEGNNRARLMFVGEAPGADEDRQGRPFVGAAGKLLDKILAAAKISREEVFITNIIKCRPPRNRMPAKEEVAACLPHLQRQIRLIAPKIIVCLGALATQTLIDDKARVSVVRGQWFERYNARIMATFHRQPAA